MTDKTQYWIADVEGVKALVEGAEARNYWTHVHGWVETTEPKDQEFVWLQHDETGGKQKFNAQAVPLWEPSGWHPCAPDDPVNLAIPPERAEAEKAERRAAKASDEKPSKSTKSTATSGTKIEE